MSKAWEAQSKSLIDVQKKGGKLEKDIKNLLGWDSGRVIYDQARQYDIQIDNVYPSKEKPYEHSFSFTYKVCI
tara:strand:+ start:806 stop:1024 length:219 start_codon:yes stop_codon:yes gene_type:complete